PRLAKRQKEIWNIIEERRELPLHELLELAQTTAGTVRRLEDKGWVTITAQISERDPYAREHILPSQPLALNPAQEKALAAITAEMDRERVPCSVFRENKTESPADPSRITEHGTRNTEHASHTF